MAIARLLTSTSQERGESLTAVHNGRYPIDGPYSKHVITSIQWVR